MKEFDVAIIGAGAAGMMCAIESGNRGRNVILIDHSKNPGEKIRISGGGRCNFTNKNTTPQNFLSQNPRFCISALNRYTQHDFIKLVEKHKIAYHEKTLGQLFCDGSSQQIINMLLEECKDANVTLQMATNINDVTKSEKSFQIKTDKGIIISESLVIATGGLSIPKMGATSFGYDIAKKFSLKIIPTRAGLVPFTLPEDKLKSLKELSGVAVENSIISYGKTNFAEAMLFTHRGLSGPAILQISSYWQQGKEISINIAPKKDAFEFLKNAREQNPKKELHTVLSEILPKSLAKYIAENSGFNSRLADLSNEKLKSIAAQINSWKIIPNGTEGYRTAEVTLGGVDTNELSSKTLECKSVPGLYFIGEVVDVTGHLGGFNFQWAWSSGYTAGQFT